VKGCRYGASLEELLGDYFSPSTLVEIRAELEARITPEVAARQDAAMRRIRERNARLQERGEQP
jgi:hypothetical protein